MNTHTGRFVPSPLMICLLCEAGGKKITRRHSVTTTRCWSIRNRTDSRHSRIVRRSGAQSSESNSILCILSLQDWLSIDGKWRNPNVQEERINVPSNPRNYWRYRMHPHSWTVDESRRTQWQDTWANKIHRQSSQEIRSLGMGDTD